MAELKEKLFQLERQLFELEMKDRWDSADFDLSHELNKKIRDIKEELEKWV